MFPPSFLSAQPWSSRCSLVLLQAIKGVRWGEYPPGMDEVILSLNASSKRYVMKSEQVNKPNQPYKPVGMLAVLHWTGGR
jgi:hypothetical protein